MLDFWFTAVESSLKSFWFIPEDRSGQKRIWEHGRCLKVNLSKVKILSKQQNVNSRKRRVSRSVASFVFLNPLTQPSKKVIYAWAIEADCDPDRIKSNSFSMEWPPKSGQMQQFPEVDRAAWFSVSEAKKRILAGQAGFIDQLCTALGIGTEREAEF